MVEKNFIGLTKRDAQNLAEAHNLLFRLIRIDDKNMFSYPEDSRDDRVCVEIEKGVVVHAAIQ